MEAKLPPAESQASKDRSDVQISVAAGNTALGSNQFKVIENVLTGETSQLQEDEEQLIILASQGGTMEQVATLLSEDIEDIRERRKQVIDKFGVPNMAAVVNQSIKSKLLPIEVRPWHKISLSENDKTVLELFAKGATNGEIMKKLGKNQNGVRAFNKGLFIKLGANGRTHSVRRAYELGIFKIDG